jgi:hypothetical protein
VFDNWISSGSGGSQVLAGGPLTYRINSGPVTLNTSLLFSFVDRFNLAAGTLSVDDGEPAVRPLTGVDDRSEGF